MGKYISARELARKLGFSIAGKLKRLPDVRFGLYGHSPLYIDEAGNEYHVGLRGDVCEGCIVTADGKVI